MLLKPIVLAIKQALATLARETGDLNAPGRAIQILLTPAHLQLFFDTAPIEDRATWGGLYPRVTLDGFTINPTDSPSQVVDLGRSDRPAVLILR